MSHDGTFTSRRSLARMHEAGASRKTVIIALAANAVIAVTKLAGGLISGSTALLAEAAHSLADTANQGFLLVSIALAKREPDEDQPFASVVEVVELLTMVLGPNALLVAARLDVDDDLDGAGVEQASNRLDRKLREALPDVTEVFLDATPASARER